MGTHKDWNIVGGRGDEGPRNTAVKQCVQTQMGTEEEEGGTGGRGTKGSELGRYLTYNLVRQGTGSQN